MSRAGRKPRVSDEEVLAAVEESEYPYSTAKRVGERLSMTPQGAGSRLRQLVKDDRLVRDEISANGVLYMLPDEISEK
jgi:hypothetical protein